jgi:hypothetical protein
MVRVRGWGEAGSELRDSPEATRGAGADEGLMVRRGGGLLGWKGAVKPLCGARLGALMGGPDGAGSGHSVATLRIDLRDARSAFGSGGRAGCTGAQDQPPPEDQKAD